MVNQGNLQKVGSLKDNVAVDKSTVSDGTPSTATQDLGSFEVSGAPEKCNLKAGETPKSDVPEANEALSGFSGFRGRYRLGYAGDAGAPGTGRLDSTKGGSKVDINTKGRTNSGNMTVGP